MAPRKKTREEIAADVGAPLPTFFIDPEDIRDEVIIKTPAHTGRPTKYNLETVTKILNGIVHGMSHKAAANLADVSEDQFYAWVNEKPDFAALVEKANAILEEWIMTSVMEQVRFNWAAGITILERRDPARWGRRDRVEHVHKGTVGLNIQQVLSSDEAIDAASALETALQRDSIEGEVVRELPAHLEES